MVGIKKNNKNIIIGLLLVVVCFIAVGYAVLSASLNINGTAEIDAKWSVEFLSITPRSIVGDASSISTSAVGTTATFVVGITKPTDSITYDIVVKNTGTISARLDDISTSFGGTDVIKYNISGVSAGASGVGTVLTSEQTATITITITFDESVTSLPSQKSSTIKLTAKFVQA